MKLKKDRFKPESLMMSYGYNPQWSEGAVKCPIFQTSTFVFKTAEEGKAFFEVAYGIREQGESEKLGLIYSRLNNPDLEILENRLALWDGADDCAIFESGMSAISTAMLEFLKPGQLILFSNPIYGGTDHFIHHILTKFGIHILGFDPADTKEEIIEAVRKTGYPLAYIHIETPANPTNELVDINMCREIADYFEKEERIIVAIDNTYLGPLWQHPLKHGADLVLYSATKYIGGHSDVIAGAISGNTELMTRIKGLRTFLGNMAGPWTGWLLMRSLETLKLRMERQAANAKIIADFLLNHSKVKSVNYLGHIKEGHKYYELVKNQCGSPGAMISFYVKDGEKEAFAFMNNLTLIKLAVSLGSTESLVQHPASMTHAGVDADAKNKYKITDNLVRLSVGVEDPYDLIKDISGGLDAIK